MTASIRTRHAGTVRLGAALGLSLGLAVLAACSSAASSSSPSSAPATTAGAAAGGSAAGLVITTKTSSAGAFLTNGSGRAIYLWMKQGKDSSACSGACAARGRR